MRHPTEERKEDKTTIWISMDTKAELDRIKIIPEIHTNAVKFINSFTLIIKRLEK
jgi:hypothetical protein